MFAYKKIGKRYSLRDEVSEENMWEKENVW